MGLEAAQLGQGQEAAGGLLLQQQGGPPAPLHHAGQQATITAQGGILSVALQAGRWASRSPGPGQAARQQQGQQRQRGGRAEADGEAADGRAAAGRAADRRTAAGRAADRRAAAADPAGWAGARPRCRTSARPPSRPADLHTKAAKTLQSSKRELLSRGATSRGFGDAVTAAAVAAGRPLDEAAAPGLVVEERIGVKSASLT